MPSAAVQRGMLRGDSLHRAVPLGDHPVYGKAGGSCMPQGNGALAFFSSGAEVPWSKYPPLNELNGEPTAP